MLGTPAHWFINANILSANYMAAIQQACRHEDGGKRAWLAWLMVPDRLSISEAADVIGFPNKTVSRVSREWCQTENILKYHITTKESNSSAEL